MYARELQVRPPAAGPSGYWSVNRWRMICVLTRWLAGPQVGLSAGGSRPCEGLTEGLSRYSERGVRKMTADEAEAPQGSTASTENVSGENADQAAVCCLERSQDENADTV